MKRRFWPAVGLFFLSPLVAEYLLGNLPITALFALIGLAARLGTRPLAARGLLLLVFAWRRVAVVTHTAAPVPKLDETIRRDQFSDS